MADSDAAPAFSAYAALSASEYLEAFGLDFEQFQPGQIFRHRPGVSLSAQENTAECLDTQNAAQVHYDAHYAAATEFGQRLGVSTLTLQKTLGMAWKTFARKDRIVEFPNISMTAPVFDGATLYAESRIRAVEDADDHCGLVTVETRALSEKGAPLAILTYRLRVFRAGRHPLYGRPEFAQPAKEARFAAYRQDEGGALVEQTGLYFDDFAVGDCFHHRPAKSVGPAEALEHARRSLDWNPRFNDPGYSRDCFTDPSAPLTEAYTISAVTAATTRTLGRVVANLEWRDLMLHRLAHSGESISCRTTVREKIDSASRPDQGILRVASAATGADGDPLMSYERVLLVYRRGHGPYKAAGY